MIKGKSLSSEDRKRAHKDGASQFNVIRNKLDAEEELDELGSKNGQLCFIWSKSSRR